MNRVPLFNEKADLEKELGEDPIFIDDAMFHFGAQFIIAFFGSNYSEVTDKCAGGAEAALCEKLKADSTPGYFSVKYYKKKNE